MGKTITIAGPNANAGRVVQSIPEDVWYELGTLVRRRNDLQSTVDGLRYHLEKVYGDKLASDYPEGDAFVKKLEADVAAMESKITDQASLVVDAASWVADTDDLREEQA